MSRKGLSGGTGDVNPQHYVVRVVQPAADTTVQTAFPLPVPKYPGSNNRAIVFELLMVRFLFGDLSVAGAAANISGAVSTSAIGTATALDVRADPRTVASTSKDFLFATAVGFQYTPDRDTTIDLRDGSGRGILIGTDEIFITLISAATGVANGMAVRMTYRLKEVGLAEYIGIVQSQQ